MSGREGSTPSVSFLPLPDGTPAAALIDALIAGSGPGKKDPPRRKVTLAGQPAVEVTTEMPDAPGAKGPKSQQTTRYLVAGKRVYLVGVHGLTGPPPAAERDAFFNSFALTK